MNQTTKRQVAVVTGGAGFIGSHLVELLLNNGYKVRCIDNFSKGSLANLKSCEADSNLEILGADIVDQEKLANVFRESSFTFHLAGIGDVVPSIENPKKYFETNVNGTLNVFEEIRKQAPYSKIIYAASSSCYGNAEVPTNENHKIQNLHPYALSKYLGETLALSLGGIYRISTNSIRIFNAYGPRAINYQTYGAVMGVFLKQKLENQPLTVIGDGLQKRDFIHVTDVARAFYHVSQLNSHGNIYNLGSGSPVSILELAHLLDGEIQYIPDRPGEPRITWANNEKLINETGWRPLIPFEDGIKDLLGKIEDWRNTPLWSRNEIANATKLWFETLASKEM